MICDTVSYCFHLILWRLWWFQICSENDMKQTHGFNLPNNIRQNILHEKLCIGFVCHWSYKKVTLPLVQSLAAAAAAVVPFAL